MIVGASTRAAAWSAWRAGYRPVCVDAFADRDLLQIAEVLPADYPAGVAAALADVDADGWMFVGAMENHRGSLRELQSLPRLGRYYGPPLTAMECLRDPFWLAERLRSLECYPDVAAASSRRARGQDAPATKWLSKPLHGGGGLGIREAHASIPPSRHYHQRYIHGTPMSALYRITSTNCERLMVCEQLIGLQEASPPGQFVFCGAIAVPSITATQAVHLDNIVATLLDGLDYCGLIGIDLVWDGAKFWVIEANPRYTASTELWELTTRQSAAAAHIAAFSDLSPRPRRGGEGQGEGASASNGSRILGKAILLADRDVIAPNLDRFLAERPTWSVPWIADVPATGAEIPKGAPVCTVFVGGAAVDEVRRKLIRRLRRVRAWFND